MITIFKTFISNCKNAETYTQSQFYKCQWQQSSHLTRGYLLYRWAIAIVFFTLLLASMLDVGKSVIDYAKYFIYLTHWGFILCTVQAILAAGLVTSKYTQLRRTNNDAEKEEILSKPSALREIYWILYSMSVVCAFGITIIFWTRVYIPSYHKLDLMVFVLHGFNTILMMTDAIIVAHPLKFMHFLWTFGFVMIYLSFSYIYYLAGGTNSKNHTFIYHSLNWDKPQHAIEFCISSLLFGFVIHTCMWIFSVTVRKISGASDVKENQKVQYTSSHQHQNGITIVNMAKS